MIRMFTTAPASGTRKTISRQLFSVLSVLVLLTACKKDKPGDDDGDINPPPPQQQEGYFATSTNSVWNYTTEDADGTTNSVMSVVSSKDSAGGKVIKYKEVFSDGTEINPFVYYTANQTVYGHNMPTTLQDLLDYLEQEPAVSDVILEGLPMLHKFPRNPQVNDVIDFSDPLHLGYSVTDEGETYNFGMYFGFSNGKVVGFEDVTTPAGTFKNCAKLQYKSTITMEGPTGVEEEESTETLWFAKGVGLVKSVDVSSDGSTSTTVLKSITNK